MSVQPIGVDLNLNAQDYVQSAGLAMQATNNLDGSLGKLGATALLVQRGLAVATPSQKHIAGMSALAAAAMQNQQALVGLAQSQAVTGQSSGQLERGINRLAQQFPIGQRGAQQMVETVNQLGIAGKGSEQSVLQLSKQMTQLSQATGEAGPAMAQGVVQLNRAFGTGNGVKSVKALSDTVTTTSKQLGVSAQGMIDFANSIAPVTKQAGLGQSATLGIAAAFQQIGQDSGAASTAVYKMLSDMNRAVRDGTPDMANYAQAVGMTVGGFKDLYQQNPAQALKSVTSALSNGPQGSRYLDQLGLDGVRTQRALQSLSQSGVLDNAINTAVGARGTGSTDKASKAADTVQAQFTRASAAAEQLATQLGTPLLHPLGAFAKLLAKVSAPVANVAGSRVVQDAGNVLAYGGLGLIAGRRLLGLGANSALIRQAATSGPVGGFIAGIRGVNNPITSDSLGRATLQGANRWNPLARVWGRTAANVGQAYERGELHTATNPDANFFQRTSGRAVEAGASLRRGLTPFSSTTGAPSFGQRISAAGWRGGLWSMAAYGQSMDAQVRMSQVPPSERPAVWDKSMAKVGLGGQYTDHYMSPQMKDDLRNFKTPNPKDMQAFNDAIRSSAREFGTLPNASRALAKGLVNTSMALPRLMGSLVDNTIGRGMLGVMAISGIAAYAHSQASAASADQSTQRQTMAAANSTNTSYGSWAEAAGQTGDIQAAFQQHALVSGAAPAPGPISMATASTVSPGDRSIAGGSTAVQVHLPSNSTAEQAAARVRMAMEGAPGNPGIVQAAKVDLIRQGFSDDFINRTLTLATQPQAPGTGGVNRIGPSGDVTIAGSGYDKSSIDTVVNQAGDQSLNRNGLHGFLGDSAGGKAANQIGITAYYGNSLLKDLTGRARLSDDSRKMVGDLVSSTDSNYQNQKGPYGDPYARQEEFRSINEAMKTAAGKKNEALVNELGDAFAAKLMGPNYKAPRVTSDDINKQGGNYIQALLNAEGSNKPGTFGALYQGYANTPGFSLDPNTSGLKPNITPGFYTTQMANWNNSQVGQRPGAAFDPQMTKLFDFSQLASGPAGPGAVPGSQPTPLQNEAWQTTGMLNQASGPKAGDQGYQQATAESFVQMLQDSGKSFSDIIRASGQLVSAFGNTSDAMHQLGLAAIGIVQQREQQQAPYQNTAQQVGQQYDDASAMMQSNPLTNPDGTVNQDSVKIWQQGSQMQTGAENKLAEMLKQRIIQYRDYYKQVGRMGEDYKTQTDRADTEYGIQKQRAQDDFNTQMTYSHDDYLLQLSRANEDFNTTQERSQRDFNLSMSRGQEDYLTQRSRSIRDFNKQLKREIEDQVQAMYDPYKRIQTQAIWDANSLVANMREQNAAIQKQSGQLAQVRKMGLSNQAIQQLSLSDPKNAQQLNQMVGDMVSDPSLIKQINQTAAQRMSLGTVLFGDQSNKAIQRQKDDFQQQLSDQETDYAKSMTRARKDFATQQSDATKDFDKQLARMDKDYQTATLRATDLYTLATRRADDDFHRQMANMQKDYEISLGRMHTDIIDATTEITVGKGGVKDLWTTLQNTMKGSMHDVNNLMSDGLDATLKIIQSKKPAAAAAYAQLFPWDLSKVGWGQLSHGVTGPPANATIAEHGMGLGGPSAAVYNSSNPAQRSQIGGSTSAGGKHGDMGYLGIEEAVADMGFGFATPSIGQTTRGGEGGSLHAAGRAVDFGDATSNAAGIARALVPFAIGPGAPIEELIYAPLGIGFKNGVNIGEAGYGSQTWADHFDHAHVGVKPGVSLDKLVLGGGGVFAGADYSDAKGPWAQLLAYADALRALAPIAQAQQQATASGGFIGGTAGAPPANEAGEVSDAKRLLGSRGWGGQFPAFNSIVMAESGWLVNARSGESPGPPDERAYGIPQALPGSKMASAGADWATNADTQLRWMMEYIATGNWGAAPFHDPNSAWAFHTQHGWYGDGGIFSGPRTIGVGERGPEAVIPLDTNGVQVLAGAISSVVKSDDLVGMMMQGRQDRVVYHHEVTNMDNRTVYAGDINVQAQDPNEMGRKLAGQKRMSNLTGSKKR